MILTSGLKATGNIVQSTPQDFFDFLNGIFRFDLDVCALPENSKCDRFFTPDMDGLAQPWGGVYGAILLTGKTSSTGSGRRARNTGNLTAASSSCCFRHGRIRSGSSSMFCLTHGYGSWTVG